MKCANCKKEVENDSVFCKYCGVKINFVSTKTVLNGFINSIIAKIENGQLSARENFFSKKTPQAGSD